MATPLSPLVHDSADQLQKYLSQTTIKQRHLNKLFLRCARSHHWDCLRILHEKGADIRKKSFFVLKQVITGGNLQLTEFFLEHDAPHFINMDQCLEIALACLSLPIALLLFSKGAKLPDKKDQFIQKALMSGHVDIVRFLLEHSTGPFYLKWDCLSFIIDLHDFQTLKFLYQNEKYFPDFDDEALEKAILKQDFTMIKWLIQHGARYYYESSYPSNSLGRCGDIEFVEWLVAHGLNLEKMGVLFHLFMGAAENNQIPMMKWLLDHGITLHEEGPAALGWAARYGAHASVEWLINQGVSPHFVDDFALRWAAWHGYLPIVQLLIDHGADLNCRYGQPLSWAAGNGYLRIVQVLVTKGTDPVHFLHATAWAAYWGHNEIVEWMLENGVNLHDGEKSLLEYAAWGGRLALIKLLISKGADLHRNYEGVIEAARRSQNQGAIQWILKYQDERS